MSLPTPLLDNGESGQPQNQEALVTVLGVCFLIIGLCAFAGLTLLFQQLQRSNSSPTVTPVPPVLTRRTAKPIAATTQFRPLSDTLRHRGDLARQLSGTSERSLGGHAAPSLPPLSTSAAPLPPPTTPLAGSEPTSTRAPLDRLLNTAPPSSIAAAASRAAPAPATSTSPGYVALTAPVPDGDTAPSAPCVPSACGSIHSGAGGCPAKGANRPIDEIDISLLTRIDEALASGVMRPNQATQLLKSYGCDLDELLQVELSDSSHDGGADLALLPTRLASAPVLSTRPRTTAATALVTDPATAAAAARAAAPMVPAAAAGTAAASPPLLQSRLSASAPLAAPSLPRQQPQPQPLLRPSKDRGLRKEGSISSLTLSGGGAAAAGPAAAAAGSGGGVVLDDAMLVKLDLALASGCVRPDQATQLLKSYGCDLEELLREELGEGSLLPSREASSGLSG